WGCCVADDDCIACLTEFTSSASRASREMDHAEREHTCARLPRPRCVRDTHQGLTPASAGARDLVEVFDVGAHGTVEALDLGVRRLDEVVLIGRVRAAPVPQ